MSKELEDFEEMYNWIYCNTETTYEDDVKLDKIRKNVKQALQRLDAIENVKPSEALEKLEETKKIIHNYISNGDYDNTIVPNLDTIKQALLKAQEQEKVLEVIKEKQINVYFYMWEECKDHIDYNATVIEKDKQLTEEEFELLKAYFGKNIQKL